jgi:hypothetical protein
VLDFVIGVVHGKVKSFATSVGQQAIVLRTTRYIFINQTFLMSISHYLFVSAAWVIGHHCFRVNLIVIFLFRNCIGALVTRMAAVKYQVVLLMAIKACLLSAL